MSSPAVDPRSWNLLIAGVGTVGSELLRQLQAHGSAIRAHGVDLRVCSVSNSRRSIQSRDGLSLENWREALAHSPNPASLQLYRQWPAAADRSIFVDCTSNEEVALSYPALMEVGLHVVSANKKANAGSFSHWRAVRAAAKKHGRRFGYSTHVGAGLPMIDTVKNLVRTGDSVRRLEGILSGSLSFILGLLEEDIPFSEAVRIAGQKGFTEPDPRDDLSGMDFARKVMILAREMGQQVEFNSAQVSSLLPDHFDRSGSVEEFMLRLPQLDASLRDRVNALRRENKVLRYVGSVDSQACRVGLVEVSENHPLAKVKGGENALSLWTERYQPTPLVIRGYGAGAGVTAGGLLADILRLAEGPLQ